jgi:holo-[acyl-carrier-protein] synthase
LLPDEIAYCLSHKNPAPFLAARFAAKEAVSKAFGTGIGARWAGRTWKFAKRNPANRSWFCTAREEIV